MIQLEYKNDTILAMMKKITLNKRQEIILKFLEDQKAGGISELMDEMSGQLKEVSKITINRDLNKLIELNYIVAIGAGRSLKYKLSEEYTLIKPIDVEKYFQKDIDEREIREKFNFNIFQDFKAIFTHEEKEFLENLRQNYLKRVQRLSPGIIKKEFERLTIELSWKSSKIEGNTYSLLETEQLLLEKKEAKGHTKEEAIMILNHKKALDFIRSNLSHFKPLTVKDIEKIHSLLIQDSGVPKNIRHSLVGITGTRFRPIDNPFQIKESLQRACDLAGHTKNIFEKAILMMLLIAYIQPFEDGNKRTSRLVGNAVLLSNKACPLSYRSIDEGEYKKAVLLFYEQNNLSHFKKLFIDQFEFATQTYFL